MWNPFQLPNQTLAVKTISWLTVTQLALVIFFFKFHFLYFSSRGSGNHLLTWDHPASPCCAVGRKFSESVLWPRTQNFYLSFLHSFYPPAVRRVQYFSWFTFHLILSEKCERFRMQRALASGHLRSIPFTLFQGYLGSHLLVAAISMSNIKKYLNIFTLFDFDFYFIPCKGEEEKVERHSCSFSARAKWCHHLLLPRSHQREVNRLLKKWNIKRDSGQAP